MARSTLRLSEPPIPSAVIARVARGERVVVRRGRKPVAIVISPEALKALEKDAGIRIVRPTRHEVNAIRAARREIKEKGTVSWERVKRELGIASN